MNAQALSDRSNHEFCLLVIAVVPLMDEVFSGKCTRRMRDASRDRHHGISRGGGRETSDGGGKTDSA